MRKQKYRSESAILDQGLHHKKKKKKEKAEDNDKHENSFPKGLD